MERLKNDSRTTLSRWEVGNGHGGWQTAVGNEHVGYIAPPPPPTTTEWVC
jgi:hypothetical protein